MTTSVDSKAPIISLEHVTLRYEQGITALDDVTLHIGPGERICVLGPNGSGKSTLASVVCGLLAPDEGTVELVGEKVCTDEGINYEAYRRARRKLGLVFQNPDDQIVTSVVEEDVAFGPENLGVPSDQIGERVERELGRVALDRYAQADPSHLSGGQKQRVAIAGALAMEPQVLVLDEPGSLLDVRGRRGIMGVMAKLQATGTTIVHVTHFMEEALDADRVVVMSKGAIAAEGTPNEVFAQEELLGSLGLEEPFAAQLATGLRNKGVNIPWTCDEGRLVDALVEALQNGRPIEYEANAKCQPRPCSDNRPETPSHPNQDTPAAVEAQSLSYSYGDTDAREAKRAALDGISFSVAQGSTTAIVGQTGSGKSTLLRLLCALERPDGGSLKIDGIGTGDRRKRRLLHGHVGYVMQHPERQLFAETVWKDVAYGPSNLHLTPNEVERRCRDALALVGLTGREEASPFHLSGGQQRLCALAGILAMEPSILVLDEPTAGLDPRGRAQLRTILNRISERGTTVIQVTHAMNDAAEAQQVMVLDEGVLVMDDSPQAVFSPDHADQLRSCGLGLPDALRLAIELEERGFTGLDNPLTLDALAETLATRIAASEEVEHGL